MTWDAARIVGAVLFCFLLFFTASLLKQERPMGARKVAHIGVLLSLALVLGLVESFIPDFLLPGMRLGLANVVILIVLFVYGTKEAFFVALLKALLVSLLRGSFLSMGGFMALTGTMLSFLGMALLHFLWKRCSPMGVSVLGSLLHVSGQILVAYAYLGVGVLGYLPWLLLVSFFTGLATGLLAWILLRRARLVAYLRR